MKMLGIKSKKAFTLIELLAVIVILGLLMAIAIPSVTKYITESRKKTLTTTLDNYIGALVNDVNDLSYTFTGQNTIYAVPIECIALERGGINPFGHWYQANDAYFAYVLIQYDDINSKYVYGFTFKDSAGYGLYPTIQANINEKGSQVKTGYTINKPVTGDLDSLVSLSKWQESGFKVDSNTNLQVLVATSEDQVGDGINTCTLQQKGDNYAQIEEEKNNNSGGGGNNSGSGNSGGAVTPPQEEPTLAKVCEGNIQNPDDNTTVTCTYNGKTETFFYIGETTDKVILLAKYNLKQDLNNAVQDASENNHLSYSQTGQYLTAYKNYLETKMGLKDVSVDLLTYEQAKALGCEDSNFSCFRSGYWVYSTNYWLGSLYNSQPWYILADNIFDYAPNPPAELGVRPVVTIYKEQVR